VGVVRSQIEPTKEGSASNAVAGGILALLGRRSALTHFHALHQSNPPRNPAEIAYGGLASVQTVDQISSSSAAGGDSGEPTLASRDP